MTLKSHKPFIAALERACKSKLRICTDPPVNPVHDRHPLQEQTQCEVMTSLYSIVVQPCECQIDGLDNGLMLLSKTEQK